MATTLEQLAKRVAALERGQRRTSLIIDDLEGRTDEQNAEMHQQFEEVKQQISTLSGSTDQRFKYVYGELADIKANTAEIRNMLATLIKRSEKPTK